MLNVRGNGKHVLRHCAHSTTAQLLAFPKILSTSHTKQYEHTSTTNQSESQHLLLLYSNWGNVQQLKFAGPGNISNKLKKDRKKKIRLLFKVGF